ncbi:MAG: MerR family DNA-binding transcriptional regulator [Actinomycetales bacterium]|nr:MerR family DNA-binding transcriptional regulator [Actinomycetales bacterium]
MTIGAVLAVLQAEFPAVTVSKLRFLEDQGLVTPTRTGSGYRKYSQADVARLRHTLIQQRDHYLPLRVIREQLDALDAGRDVEEPRTARVVASNGRLVLPASGARVTARELAELTGVPVADIDEMVRAGLLVPDGRGRFAAQSVSAVHLIAELGTQGIAPRHLRSMRANADHVADLVDQVVAPMRAQRTSVARERGAAQAAELAETAARLYADLLRIAVENQDH